jgi:hypothetical protein
MLKSELQLLKSQQIGNPVITNCSNNNNNNTINDNKTINKTINVFTYVNSNYQNAEPLIPLQKPKITEMLTIDSKKYKGHCLCDFVVSYHRKHSLHEYLGEIIINAYKKKNPEEQQFWSSDVARLSFIVRRVLDQDDIIWTNDKKGVYIEKTIITPLLEELKLIISDHIDKLEEKIKVAYLNDLSKMIEYKGTLSLVCVDIKDRNLHPKILTYITPHFHLDPSPLT